VRFLSTLRGRLGRPQRVRARRARGDRGVTGVEYTLILAAMVTGSTATFQLMDNRVEEHYVNTAEDVSQIDLAYFDVTTTVDPNAASTTTTAAPTTSAAASSTTSTSTSTTTTTAAPTTTTTTAAPTTTAAATTTTTVATESSEIDWSDRSSWRSSCGCYRAKTKLKIKDDDGDELTSADVAVIFTLSDGSEYAGSGTTNSSGKVGFSLSGLSSSDFDVVVTITSIVGNDGTTYSPDIASFTLTT